MLKPVQNRGYWFMLMVQAFLFFISPFTREQSFLFLLLVFGLFGIFGTVILTIWQARLLAIGSAVVALAAKLCDVPSRVPIKLADEKILTWSVAWNKAFNPKKGDSISSGFRYSGSIFPIWL